MELDNAPNYTDDLSPHLSTIPVTRLQLSTFELYCHVARSLNCESVEYTLRWYEFPGRDEV